MSEETCPHRDIVVRYNASNTSGDAWLRLLQKKLHNDQSEILIQQASCVYCGTHFFREDLAHRIASAGDLYHPNFQWKLPSKVPWWKRFLGLDAEGEPASFPAFQHPTFKQAKIMGCLLGGTLGDALGFLVEGKDVSREYNHEGRLRISDDTQLTLATCEAVLESRGVSPEALARQFLQWYRQRRFRGLGSSTLKALRDLEVGTSALLSGAVGERSAGNGAAMRIAPLAFLLDAHHAPARQLIRDVVQITHRHDEAYAGALAIMVAIFYAATDGCPDDLLPRTIASVLPDSVVRDRLLEIQTLPGDTPLTEIVGLYGNSGYVADSVPLAVQAARRGRSRGLLSTLEEVIAMGGDTDTNASLTGQILGARLGIEQLSKVELDRIDDLDAIERTFSAFAQLVGN